MLIESSRSGKVKLVQLINGSAEHYSMRVNIVVHIIQAVHDVAQRILYVCAALVSHFACYDKDQSNHPSINRINRKIFSKKAKERESGDDGQQHPTRKRDNIQSLPWCCHCHSRKRLYLPTKSCLGVCKRTNQKKSTRRKITNIYESVKKRMGSSAMDDEISLETTIAGIPLKTCVYNASGPRTGSSAALGKIAASQAGAVLTKSATLVSQTGNPQPRTWHSSDDKASMNSEGLPNSGIDYYISDECITETMENTNDSSKPYLVSISGKTLDDNLAMLDKISKIYNSSSSSSPNNNKITAVELNLACPNVIGKPIIAYDFDQMKMIFQTLQGKNYPFPLGVKLPPYLDGKHLSQAASIINDYKTIIKYVVCINTIGNALSVDSVSEAPYIASNNGLAGLSGAACKYTALANVRQMRNQLSKEIDVIGVGGLETGEDVFNMLLCGATAVQIGTCHWKEGPKCFDRICDELRTLLKEKGYTSSKEVVGQLKTWSKDGAAKSRAAAKAEKEKAKAASGSSNSNNGDGQNQHQILNAILIAIICILLVDKFGK